MFIVWRGFLYNQQSQMEAILSQYEMEIYEVTKGRGTYICNTSKGVKVLTGFRGAKEKGEALRKYLARLNEVGFPVEQIELNRENEAVTVDEITAERFILKEYISGSEINVNQLGELKEAASLLAEYHNASVCIASNSLEQEVDCSQMVVAEKEKHYRELIKVKNYIRNRKKKNEFERIYLNCYENMMQTSEESLEILKKEQNNSPVCCFCHGDYNQHNIVWWDTRWQIINFENFVYHWCILDLANFLRKMQEKNEWDLRVGNGLLEAYTKVRSLSMTEKEKLYGLLLFPEKFWKVANHYMNSRKTWVSEKDIEKLKKVIEQEEKRINYVKSL